MWFEILTVATGTVVAVANLWAAIVLHYRYPDSRAWYFNVAVAVGLTMLVVWSIVTI